MSSPEQEYEKMLMYKSTLDKFILNSFNSFSLNNMSSKLEYKFYSGQAIPGYTFRSHVWKIYIIGNKIATPNHFEVYIHNGDYIESIGRAFIAFYLVPEGKNEKGYIIYKLVKNESDYNRIRNDYTKVHNTTPIAQDYNKAKKECVEFANDLRQQIIQAHDSKKWATYSNTLHEIINTYNYLSTKYRKICNITDYNYNKFIKEDFEVIAKVYLDLNRCSEEDKDMFKLFIIGLIKSIYISASNDIVRKRLTKQLETDGIEEIVNVEVDNSINLGDFIYVKNIIEAGTTTYEQIIKNSFTEIINTAKLHASIVQLLKLYYDFNHPSENNELYLAAFLQANNLTRSKFVDTLCEASPRAVNTLWDSLSTDSKRKYAEKLPKDSTYRCTKTAYIRKSVYINKDDYGHYIKTNSNAVFGQELLNKMRTIIPIYNEKSEFTKILSINFGNDKDSFVFDFITYKSDYEIISGKRLSEFTEMFNKGFDEVLYLTYDNEQ